MESVNMDAGRGCELYRDVSWAWVCAERVGCSEMEGLGQGLDGEDRALVCVEVPQYEPTHEEIVECADYLGIREESYFWVARECLKAPLPKNYVPCKFEKSGRVFFYNKLTGESSYEHPLDRHYKRMYLNQREEDFRPLDRCKSCGKKPVEVNRGKSKFGICDLMSYGAFIGLSPSEEDEALWKIASDGIRAGLDLHWKMYKCCQGNFFYFNHLTGEKRSSFPYDEHVKEMVKEVRQNAILVVEQEEEEVEEDPKDDDECLSSSSSSSDDQKVEVDEDDDDDSTVFAKARPRALEIWSSTTTTTNENNDSSQGSTVLEEIIDPYYEPTESEISEYARWLGMTLPEDNHFLWIAREGLKAPLPDNWKPCKTLDTKEIYYFNFSNGESTWNHPCDDFYRNLYEEEKRRLHQSR